MKAPMLRLLSAATALVLAAGLAACAHSDRLNASDEGTYVRIGHLKYQVQLSRQLNPSDLEDARYVAGLTRAERLLKPDQAFFAVWLRVENASGQPRNPALGFEISDTQGRLYRPIVPDQTNVFAYRTTTIPPYGQVPDPQSIAYASPTQGALLLFKVNVGSYDNRPLTLAIADPVSATTGHVDLDV